jgi:hypothetical protein
MDSSRVSSKLTETIIGYCLLILLALIAAAIFLTQFHYDPERLNTDFTTTEVQTNQKDTKADLLSLLPSGFKAKTKPEIFDSDSLYEKINGKAGMYLEAGFKKLRCLRFASDQDENLWAEILIYDMGDPRNAFAVFSTQRRADATPLSITRFAYKAGESIFLTAAGNYVEVITGHDSKKLQNSMLDVAKNIIKISPDTNDSISELGLFPKQNLRDHSFKLYLQDAFGFDGIDNTYTAGYLLSDQPMTAFISVRQNQQQAQKMAEQFRNFFTENGAVPATALDKDLSGFVLNFYDSIEVVFAVENYVVGVHQGEDQLLVEKLALILKNKLTKVNSDKER